MLQVSFKQKRDDRKNFTTTIYHKKLLKCYKKSVWYYELIAEKTEQLKKQSAKLPRRLNNIFLMLDLT